MRTPGRVKACASVLEGIEVVASYLYDELVLLDHVLHDSGTGELAVAVLVHDPRYPDPTGRWTLAKTFEVPLVLYSLLFREVQRFDVRNPHGVSFATITSLAAMRGTEILLGTQEGASLRVEGALVSVELSSDDRVAGYRRVTRFVVGAYQGEVRLSRPIAELLPWRAEP